MKALVGNPVTLSRTVSSLKEKPLTSLNGISGKIEEEVSDDDEPNAGAVSIKRENQVQASPRFMAALAAGRNCYGNINSDPNSFKTINEGGNFYASNVNMFEGPLVVVRALKNANEVKKKY